MQRSSVPFNVFLLQLTADKLRGLKPVRSLDIFEGSTDSFHEDGLFSVSIFGRIGDERRSMRFSYIDIKIPIFHPVIFRTLGNLKRLYAGIMSGQEYAVWDDSARDFVRSTALAGKTGYDFFLSHWKEIAFAPTTSDSREQNILLLKKYQEKSLTDKIVVLPAGMRDIQIDDGGRITEDEINTFYRKLLSISNTLNPAALKSNPEIINSARYSLQVTFNQLYDTLENMIEGKKKLFLGKFASRRIMDGTRNVITAMDTGASRLGSPRDPGFNNTMMGLYQAMKAARPVARYHLRNGFLKSVFQGVNSPARLINMETLKSEAVALKPAQHDRWATDEGLELVINSFRDVNIRHKPVIVEGRYVGLIYKGPDDTYRLMNDIDELPEWAKREHVHPITLCELLYLSTFRALNKLPVLVTRYPVTGVGSIYPSFTFVTTTVETEQRLQLADDWKPMPMENMAWRFPTSGPFMDTLVPHSAKLQGMGADFDGDTSSANVLYMDESIREIQDFLASKRAYVGTDGKFISSMGVSTVDLVLHNLTAPAALAVA